MHTVSRRRDFADCVRTSARDEALVTACNREHGTQLQAPIDALLRGATDVHASAQNAAELLCFIGFVHRRVWRSVLVARRRRNWRVPKAIKSAAPAVRSV